MRKYTFCITALLLILVSTVDAQEAKSKWFISTNSGILNTPIGIKIGRIGDYGFYLGTRFGKGDMYNDLFVDPNRDHISNPLTHEEWVQWQDNYYQKNGVTNFSIVIGGNMKVYRQNNLSVHLQAGIGYARWWKEYRESWQNLDGGVELEAGALLKYKNWICNLTGNYLFKDQKVYGTGDCCVGIGYCF